MIMSEFQKRYTNRHEIAKQWKNEGKKIFGYFCSYVPEELIDAAGIIPVRIMGSLETIEKSDTHMPTYICAFARRCLDQGLKGHYDYLDGIVTSKTCDIMRNLPSIWARNIDVSFSACISAPSKRTDIARECLIEELNTFRSSLSEFTGNEITDESINQSIEIYNQSRQLLTEISEFRKDKNYPLLGSEFYDIVKAGFVMPKKEYNEMLISLKNDLLSSKSSDSGKMRLLISGSTFEDVNIHKMIEDLGGNVVCDDLCIGSRYYSGLVASGRDPLRALADRYQTRVTCPCKHPSDERLDKIISDAKEYNVKGVISIVQKFCDSHLFEVPYMRNILQENNIPFLYLETEDRLGEEGQFKTRIQAFMEMLQ